MSSDIGRLFKPLKDLLFGTHYYTYILWALEALTCYKQYAIRAIKIFAEISEKTWNIIWPILRMNHYIIFLLMGSSSCLSDDDEYELSNNM